MYNTIETKTTITFSTEDGVPVSTNDTTKPASNERIYATAPVTEDDIQYGVKQVLAQMGCHHLTIRESYYALGIQSYQWLDGKYQATGPLANLYPVDQRTMTHPRCLTKIGFHNNNIEKPSWEIHRDGKEIELLARRAHVVNGASDTDVPWLYVELDDNPYGYTAIIRSQTRGGIAPTDNHCPGSLGVGVGYQTIYTLISGESKTYQHECIDRVD